MLYLDFKYDKNNVCKNPESWYDIWYEQSWFDDPNIVQIACAIDKLKHEWADFFTSETFGRCSGKNLSGGAKTVIVGYLGLCDKEMPFCWMGENCYRLLALIPESVDVTFAVNYTPMIWDFGCTFISKQTGHKITNYDEFKTEEADLCYT